MVDDFLEKLSMFLNIWKKEIGITFVESIRKDEINDFNGIHIITNNNKEILLREEE